MWTINKNKIKVNCWGGSPGIWGWDGGYYWAQDLREKPFTYLGRVLLSASIPANIPIPALSSRVVKFRRTGESARSEDGVASGEHEVQIEGVRVGLEAVELDDGAAVPKEFANPTDGK